MRVIPGTIVGGRSKEGARNGIINVEVMIVKAVVRVGLKARAGVVTKEIAGIISPFHVSLEVSTGNAIGKEGIFKGRRLRSLIYGWILYQTNKEWGLLPKK